MEADEIDTALAPAFYLLIGFAIELLLKAICLRAGVTQKEIRSFSHDLHKAYMGACKFGKVPGYMTPFGRLVLELDQHHRDYSFRYTPDVAELVVPPPGHCVRVLDEQIAVVSANW
jgi:hypothetical protein